VNKQKNKISIFTRTRKSFLFFLRETNVLTKIISWFGKRFLAQRETQKFFRFLFFSFRQTTKPFFFVGHKLLTQRKMMKVFHFFYCSFRFDTKNNFIFFAFLFRRTIEISKTKF